MWYSIPICIFIGNTFPELFGKTDRQIYKQTRETFYILNDMCLQYNVLRRKNISCIVAIRYFYKKAFLYESVEVHNSAIAFVSSCLNLSI